MHAAGTFKLVYINKEHLRVSNNHAAIFSDVKYKGYIR
jgi:hypothetical protein